MGMRQHVLNVSTLGLLSACATAHAPIEAYALTRTATEQPGPNCPKGGSKIDIGQDQNTNGTLDAEEVTGGVFACNGPDGALVEASTLPVHDANCPRGGIEVRTGTDTNRNGKLDTGEFESNYSCNAASSAQAKQASR